MSDRSEEALLARRKVAQRATPGPWAAYHEVLEVLLSPLRCLAFDDDLPTASRTRLLNAEAHAIIRRLEYLAYGVDAC